MHRVQNTLKICSYSNLYTKLQHCMHSWQTKSSLIENWNLSTIQLYILVHGTCIGKNIIVEINSYINCNFLVLLKLNNPLYGACMLFTAASHYAIALGNYMNIHYYVH